LDLKASGFFGTGSAAYAEQVSRLLQHGALYSARRAASPVSMVTSMEPEVISSETPEALKNYTILYYL